MHFTQSFTLLLAITPSFFLIADRIRAEETEEPIFGCKGKLLERKLGSRKFQRIQHNLNDTKLPERFDPREKWPSCKSLYHIKDQGRCGGCWAFASSSVMSDRLCIATQGKYNEILSEQDLLECCTYCVDDNKEDIGGCEGGYSIDAYRYWEEYGLVTGYQGCKPTEKSIAKGIPQKECRQRCTNKSHKVEYNTDRTFSIKTFMTYPARKGDIEHIMAEIMLNGPVGGSMKTYKYIKKVPSGDILQFDESSVKKGEEAVGHAIKILGWDNIKGTPVWIVANSWGDRWCNKGFCYIRRGQNDFQIEIRFYAGIPKMKVSKRENKPTEKTDSSGFNLKITYFSKLAVILCILTIKFFSSFCFFYLQLFSNSFFR